MTKRAFFALVLAVALAAVLPTVAMANFAVHGQYLSDTDACAGCHRAHTSVSTLTWTTSTSNTERSALLASSATKMQDFCYACHDASSQGADTNVQEGIYEGSAFGSQDATLNGGGFDSLGLSGAPVTSKHDSDGHAWGAYGGGNFGSGDTSATGQQDDNEIGPSNVGESQLIEMDCATCHDPHGSANYRILRAKVFGNPVGGYEPSATAPADPTPDGWVQSTEKGWPSGGFRLHTLYPNYIPDYTTPRYAKGYDMAAGTENAQKGMTGWCSGCHTTYNEESSVYNSGDGQGLPTDPADPSSPINSLVTRHRHPVNIDFNTYDGPDKESMIVTGNVLPVAHDLSEASTSTPHVEATDWVECLTCHRAHGTASVMSGYANERTTDPLQDPLDKLPDFVSASGGGYPSALLRNDNRGVCEACHNK